MHTLAINLQSRPFESQNFCRQICKDHIRQIKNKLGISGVLTKESSWFLQGNEDPDGAQIDCGLTISDNPQNQQAKTLSESGLDCWYMIIDRDDRIINLCEMKFSTTEFEITEEYQQNLINKIETFRTDTKTKKTLQLTFVTSFGVKKNMYSGKVQRQITLDDLFDP